MAPNAPRCVMYLGSMTPVEVEVNRQGRVTIPAQIRHLLGLREGTKLVARVEDGQLILEQRSHVLARFQQRLAAAAAEAGYPSGDVVDSLIADRRAEAAAENATR